MIQADVKTDLTGFKRIDEELRQYVESHMDGIAEAVADYAREYCPEDKGVLKKSIKVEKINGGRRVITRDPKSHLLELGHVQEDHKGNIVGHVRPYPFMRPAKEVVVNELLRSGGKGYDFAKASGVFDDYWRG